MQPGSGSMNEGFDRIGGVEVNGRRYRLPTEPVVVVCVDGSEPGYIEKAVEAGAAPFFCRVLKSGTNALAECVVMRRPATLTTPASGSRRPQTRAIVVVLPAPFGPSSP